LLCIIASASDRARIISAYITEDQNIETRSHYWPDKLRRVSYVDKKRNKCLVFLTYNFLLPAQVITEIYKQRWQVELFFKWVKRINENKRKPHGDQTRWPSFCVSTFLRMNPNLLAFLLNLWAAELNDEASRPSHLARMVMFD
jgi:hypothetical protein